MGKNSKKPSKGKAKAKGAKAGARPVKPIAALYNLDANTPCGDAVRAVLAEQGIGVRTVTADQLGSPVGAIMGLPGFRTSTLPFTGEVPTCEFMLLDNVPSSALNALLAAMRDADCSVGCKAQVTVHNRLWPFATLVENVAREHEAMQQATPTE